ncbi:type III-A CRISPR-associated protein Csm2 [Pelotomaculum propionicicum]|uniref:type III-A CRISPR-associated protein Csm2 n=1 Tax=Pelotomaculum propionicicum TaxID=258475 RepID=UPI003B7DC080
MSGDMREALRKAGLAGEPLQPAKTQTRGTDNTGRAGSRGAPPAQPSRSQTAAAQFTLGENYTAQADQVIQELKRSLRDYQRFTTSKIRNILAMVSEIYNDVITEQDDLLSPELQSRIEYLKVRLVYECGREPYVVKPFVTKAGLLDLLNNIGGSRENFKKFSRYMEALVAYHRYYGGQDK